MDEVRRFVGNGVEKLMIRAIAGGKGNPKFDETFALFKEYYGIHCKDHTGPYPGILFLMEELKQRGIRMAIVSNKLDSAVKELDREYFSGYTDAAIGEMEGVARKPAPDTVEKALAELGITRDEAIYVGDSDVDIETAKNAGLPCVSVTWGFRDEAFLREHGAERIIQKPFELLKII
jgi:phosphoglycolate phosphatase